MKTLNLFKNVIMGFCEVFFNKSLRELTYDDIAQYFSSPKQETENLEFKSYDIQKDFDQQLNANILKGLSAFLNSSGGVLIWGAPRGSSPGAGLEKEFQGGLCPLNVLKQKDSLINIIAARVSPMPSTIRVEILSHEDKHIYVFEVDQSPSKPHQFNNCYYVRLDGQSRPAPHYLVEALFKQIKYPDIGGYIRFNKITLNNQDGSFLVRFSVLIKNFSPLQNEENLSYQLVAGPGTINLQYKGEYNSVNIPVFSSGRIICDEFTLMVQNKELEENKGKLFFVLSFHGKHSPTRFTDYELDLTTYQASKVPNDYLVKIKENLFAYEEQERLGNNKANFPATFLNRKT